VGATEEEEEEEEEEEDFKLEYTFSAVKSYNYAF
jgi:hypothetical protein